MSLLGYNPFINQGRSVFFLLPPPDRGFSISLFFWCFQIPCRRKFPFLLSVLRIFTMSVFNFIIWFFCIYWYDSMVFSFNDCMKSFFHSLFWLIFFLFLFLIWLHPVLAGALGLFLGACGSSSLTRDWTWVPELGAWSLNHWTTRECWWYAITLVDHTNLSFLGLCILSFFYDPWFSLIMLHLNSWERLAFSFPILSLSVLGSRLFWPHKTSWGVLPL